MATIKALHAVLLQMTRPGMSDMEAIKSMKASKSNFVQWKRMVRMHATTLFRSFSVGRRRQPHTLTASPLSP